MSIDQRQQTAAMSSQPVETFAGKLRLVVDPRIELMAIAQMIGAYRDNWPLMTWLDFAYRRDVESALGGYGDHPTIQRLNEIWARPASVESPPFAFSGPAELMLHMNGDFGLLPETPRRELLVRRLGDSEILLELASALREFAAAIGFDAFYADHRESFRCIVEATAEKARAGADLAVLEDFYGMAKQGYTVVLVPLYATVGYGLGIGSAGEPDEAIYNVMGPNDVEDDLPVFGAVDYFRYMVRHEFSHPHVNPLTEQHWDQIKVYDQFDQIKELMRKGSYGDWSDAVNEHVIRAITTWLAYQESVEAGDAALQRELDRGFVFLPPLLEKLDVYTQQRDRYPTFASFYPKLVTAFETPVDRLL